MAGVLGAGGIAVGEYRVHLARDARELEAAQRLRFEVFNLELHEGLAEAATSGLDRDRFDAQCDHLLLTEAASGAVVGTYRLQTRERARAAQGFYCDEEFELDALPLAVLDDAVELGRACIHAGHRHGQALFALWRGIAAYLTAHGKRLLFGCCSLTGTDPQPGLCAARWLGAAGHRHREFDVPVRAAHRCTGPAPAEAAIAAFEPPKLFSTYLRFGAQVCSEAAIDHAFGTTDFLVLMDTGTFDPRLRAMFFAPLRG